MENKSSSGGDNFCQNCGNSINPVDKFCGSCGQAVSGQEKNIQDDKGAFLGRVEKPVFVFSSDFLKERLKRSKKTIAVLVIILILLTLGVSGPFIKNRKDVSREIISEKTENNEISSLEINKIAQSLVFLHCFGKDRTKDNPYGSIFGSGILLDKKILAGESFNEEDYSYKNSHIITNGHVAELTEESPVSYMNNCVASFSPDEIIRTYSYNDSSHFLDGRFDVALLKYAEKIGDEIQQKPYIKEEILKERTLKNYPICSKDKMIGNKVYILGYPSATFKLGDGGELSDEAKDFRLIITSGLISGTNSEGNFYTDAKIDSGNSGGLAISKIDNKICLAGIPTWISLGSYENLGIIQPFEDVANLLREDFIKGEYKLYQNNNYNFSIKFPSEWNLSSDEKEENSFSKESRKGPLTWIRVSVFETPENSVMREDILGERKTEFSSIDLNNPINRNSKNYLENLIEDSIKNFPENKVMEKGITFLDDRKSIYYRTAWSMEKENGEMGGVGQSVYYTAFNNRLYKIVSFYEKGTNANYDKAIINRAIKTFSFQD